MRRSATTIISTNIIAVFVAQTVGGATPKTLVALLLLSFRCHNTKRCGFKHRLFETDMFLQIYIVLFLKNYMFLLGNDLFLFGDDMFLFGNDMYWKCTGNPDTALLESSRRFLSFYNVEEGGQTDLIIK